MLVMEAYQFFLAIGTLWKSKDLDLSTMTLRSEAMLKLSIMLATILPWEVLALKNRRTLLAKEKKTGEIKGDHMLILESDTILSIKLLY